MEIWKGIHGWENFYQVSNFGRVRSLTRTIYAKRPYGSAGYRIYKGKILKTDNIKSYPHIKLTKNSKSICINVHRLVLENFIGPCPKNYECCHWDNNRKNNKLSNLRWASRKDNMADKKRHGTQNNIRGEKIHCAKLNSKKVIKIRKLKGIISSRKVGIKFNISKSQILDIWNNKSWSHVK